VHAEAAITRSVTVITTNVTSWESQYDTPNIATSNLLHSRYASLLYEKMADTVATRKDDLSKAVWRWRIECT